MLIMMIQMGIPPKPSFETWIFTWCAHAWGEWAQCLQTREHLEVQQDYQVVTYSSGHMVFIQVKRVLIVEGQCGVHRHVQADERTL